MMSVLLVAVPLTAPLPAEPPGEPAVRLTVRPMAAPRPALRYQLLPEVRELSPGNPVQWYVRCFAEQRYFFFRKDAVAARAKYRSMPLAELPVKELREYGGNALTQADWGARLDTPDWGVLQRVQTEGTDLKLPELDPLWVLATALQVRFRGEIADGRFDDAIRTAKTLFAFARHLGEYPASAGNLLGVAVALLALDTLEEMVQQPGCPNLYWALTDLPCPLVDLRKGIQGDRVLAAAELRGLRDDRPMTEDELHEFVSRLSGRLGFLREQVGRSPGDFRVRLGERVKDADRVGAARDRLVGAGCSRDLVEKFPPIQVILLDEKRDYEERRDEEMKLLALPPWQIDALPRSEAGGLFTELMPRVIEARRLQARVEQRIGLLRDVEALRMYAAAHDGRLPAKLADVGVPLPLDPFTGKPFEYAVDGATARLRGGSPKGEEKNPAFGLRYEITIRK
jgi:hypothetical protein